MLLAIVLVFGLAVLLVHQYGTHSMFCSGCSSCSSSRTEKPRPKPTTRITLDLEKLSLASLEKLYGGLEEAGYKENVDEAICRMKITARDRLLYKLNQLAMNKVLDVNDLERMLEEATKK